jgi:hypothetical protein
MPSPDPTEADASTAWKRDCDALYYAARGLSEHTMGETLRACEVAPTMRELALIRLTIACTVTESGKVLRAAGWLGDEPPDPDKMANSQVPAWAEQAQPMLDAWDADPQGI